MKPKMLRRDWLKTACIPAVSLMASQSRTTIARPNVILILTDDQGYGDLSCHGNPILKTPNLDKLHSQSVRFTDFHVAPMCTPTRGQLLTGRNAVNNRATAVCMGRSLPRPDLPTMADVFASSGYRTGIFGKWHLGDNYPYRPQDRGFQETLNHPAWGITSLADHFGNDYFNSHLLHNGKDRQFKGYCTDVWFEEATNWIKARSARREPFFCYLPTNAAHSPLWVPDRYRDPYRDKVPPDVASFYAMIACIDENIGRMMTMLDETGVAGNTILIFMTDNGTATGENIFNAGMRGRKTQLYEGGHRVPCFVRWPGGGLGKPRDIDSLAHCQDILPTLADLCKLKTPEKAALDGVSLGGVLRTQTQLPDRMLIIQFGGQLVKRRAAVLWNKWRLLNGKELYDLRADPAQKTDVSSQNPEIVSRMLRHYDQWWEGVMPAAQEYQRIVIGSEKANPTRLNASDWNGVYCDSPFCYMEGESKNGAWSVRIATEGNYRFSLRRWPQESGLSLASAAPAQKRVDVTSAAGKALPIASARIRIGDFEESKPVTTNAAEVIFLRRLKPGDERIQTWFYDERGKELCGAYYLGVERLAN